MKFLMVVGIILLLACETSLATKPCVTLEHKECSCENGTIGAQVCKKDGTYSKCFCDISK